MLGVHVSGVGVGRGDVGGSVGVDGNVGGMVILVILVLLDCPISMAATDLLSMALN